jgi:uncharacterized membrane protein
MKYTFLFIAYTVIIYVIGACAGAIISYLKFDGFDLLKNDGFNNDIYN